MSKSHINLPKTAFSMKANLPIREPEILKYWEEINLYQELRNSRKGNEKFILHDGPPYANGDIHMGTALNKILKDIIVKFNQMDGKDSVYVPGWDCHGLPIEWKIEEQYKKNKKNKNEIPIVEFRKECRSFAEKWIEIHKTQFKRFGGAGRVGHYAIQWAHRAGARVIATASNEQDAAACREAGAEAVVNHREPEWGKAVLDLAVGQKVDRVIEVEFGANLPELLHCVRIGATIATYSSTVVPEPELPFRTMMFMDLTVRMVIVYAMPEDAKAQAVSDTQAALTEGGLQHRIAETLPFDQMAKAHEIIEAGSVRGCVVVTI